MSFFFFFQAEDGIRDADVTGVQTCALPIFFFASNPSPAAVYGGAPALTVGPASFPAATTTSVPISAPNLAAPVRDLFKGSALYIGIRGTISNTGATGLKTTLKLTRLQARIVLQDKFF